MTYSVVRQPRRGQVTVDADGSFTYTPKRNKVGVDSFTYTAADAAGNVSRTATVTIQILKPSDGRRYTDTVGLNSRFEAEWLRNTGLFAAEQVGGELCFQPEKAVTRSQFLVMLLELMETPLVDTANAAAVQSAPVWLRPYLSAALRSGLVDESEEFFDADAPITAEEAQRWLAALSHETQLSADGVLTRSDTACLLYNTAHPEE